MNASFESNTRLTPLLKRVAMIGVLAATILGAARAASAAEPRIVFLDPAAAADALLDDSQDPYFELLQPLEMAAKSGSPLEGDLTAQRQEFRRRYRGAVRAFDDSERQLLRQGVERVHPYLMEHYSVLAGTPWSFLKVTSEVESGLPHTRGGHIMISEPLLGMLRALDAAYSERFTAELLIHEQMHVAQRAHREAFEKLYSSWGFKRVGRMAGDEWLVEHQVVNPDGPNRWVYPVPEGDGLRWIWPTLLLDQPASQGQPNLLQMQMIAVTLSERDGQLAVRLGPDGKPVYGPLMQDRGYVEAFSFATDLYHPNEITASAMARGAVMDLFGAPPEQRPAGANIDALRAWFSKHLHGGGS